MGPPGPVNALTAAPEARREFVRKLLAQTITGVLALNAELIKMSALLPPTDGKPGEAPTGLHKMCDRCFLDVG